MSLTKDDVDRAEEIVNEMVDLLDEFDGIIRHGDRLTYERFTSYPKGHISMSLSSESNYVGGMFPLDELVNDMRSRVEDEEENEDSEDE